MTIKFKTTKYALQPSDKLFEMLERTIIEQSVDLEDCEFITLCFRDESYSQDKGGFHPVEIRLIKGSKFWELDYITDFCFAGVGQDCELVKEVDFDFTNSYGFHLYTGEYPLSHMALFYQLWEGNFLSYVDMGVFKVTTYC